MVRTLRLLTIAAILMLAMPVGVQAASPHQVDPDTMVPPLNPGFGPWICTDTGGGPICRGEEHGTWAAEDIGLECAGQAIYTSGWSDSEATRWHLPDGRAVHTFFKNQVAETWTLSPAGDGRAVIIKASWNQHYVYPIPGDRPTRVMTITGADWQATAKGYGLVFHDTGFARFLPGSEDELDYTHGPTDSDHGQIELVIDEVCAILLG
jgi:hypothetical protein